MDRPNPATRLASNVLRLWRSLKLAELFKGLRESGKPQGTVRRKVRWRRAEALNAKKRNKARRARARTKLTKKLQRRRLLVGQNLRTGKP